jgi:uncharacterized protein (TIGR03000 family)
VEWEDWTPSPAALPAATAVPTSASLRVSMPADAKLSVGDFNTESSGSVRFFQSPPLVEGKTYAYELCAEVNRSGRTVTETKTIVVRAGQSAEVDFALDDDSIAQANER